MILISVDHDILSERPYVIREKGKHIIKCQVVKGKPCTKSKRKGKNRLSKQTLQDTLQLICKWVIIPSAALLVKTRWEINCSIRIRPRRLISMVALSMPSGLPRTIRSLVVLAPSVSLITSLIAIPMLRFRRSLSRRLFLWIQIKLHCLISRLDWTGTFWFVYTICKSISPVFIYMGRQRP